MPVIDFLINKYSIVKLVISLLQILSLFFSSFFTIWYMYTLSAISAKERASTPTKADETAVRLNEVRIFLEKLEILWMLHFSVQRHSMIYSRLIFWCDYHSHVKSVDELLKEVPGMSQAHSMYYAKQNTNSKLVIIVQWQQIFLVEAKSFSVIMVDSWHHQIRNVWLSKLA